MTNTENEIRSKNYQTPAIMAVQKYSAMDYFDLTHKKDIGEHFDLSFGVINLFDKEPPILGSANRDANTDPSTYDVLGRLLLLRITARY